MKIGDHEIGLGQPVYIIAELSANHNQNLGRAIQLIDAAKEAGADAIKLQTYTPDTITIDHDGPDFRLEDGPWRGRTLHALYQEAHLPWDWHEPLFADGAKGNQPTYKAFWNDLWDGRDG